ncbi:unnamed protein product [Phaeothamnion confervicola]
MPTKKWRFYVFKDKELISTLHLHRQSAYLVGREQKIADIHVAHPSCSKQHAVLQFRYRPVELSEGELPPPGGAGGTVRPYIIDLESANGTFVNGERMRHSCYFELREQDVLKFGVSSREYVLLHENSAS